MPEILPLLGKSDDGRVFSRPRCRDGEALDLEEVELEGEALAAQEDGPLRLFEASVAGGELEEEGSEGEALIVHTEEIVLEGDTLAVVGGEPPRFSQVGVTTAPLMFLLIRIEK